METQRLGCPRSGLFFGSAGAREVRRKRGGYSICLLHFTEHSINRLLCNNEKNGRAGETRTLPMWHLMFLVRSAFLSRNSSEP